MKTEIKAADKNEEKLFYVCDEKEIKTAKIGHLRLDFGSGKQFYITWFGGNPGLKFLKEYNILMKILRKDLLKDRSAMDKFIREHPSLDLGSRGNGYKIQTDEHTYYLRCKPQPGDYDCYCFCYERELLEQAMAEDMTEEENIEMEMNT